MEVEIKGLKEFYEKLELYKKYIKLTASQAAFKKGNDIRIKMVLGFMRLRTIPGTFLKELEMRNVMPAGKRGIQIDAGFKHRRRWDQIPISANAPEYTRANRRTSAYQKAVFTELETRSRGIGLLGISLIDKGYGKSRRASRGFKVEGTVNTSRILGELARFNKRIYGDRLNQYAEYEVKGFTRGLMRQAKKYGIIENAISAVNADMQIYLDRKVREAATASRMTN